jgi:hypothetical protein
MQEEVNLMHHDLSFEATTAPTAAATTASDPSASHLVVNVGPVAHAPTADQRAQLLAKAQSTSKMAAPKDGVVIINPLYNE